MLVSISLAVLPPRGCGQPDTKIVALTPDIVVAPEEVAFGDVVKLYTANTEVQIINSDEPLSLKLNSRSQAATRTYSPCQQTIRPVHHHSSRRNIRRIPRLSSTQIHGLPGSNLGSFR